MKLIESVQGERFLFFVSPGRVFRYKGEFFIRGSTSKGSDSVTITCWSLRNHHFVFLASEARVDTYPNAELYVDGA